MTNFIKLVIDACARVIRRGRRDPINYSLVVNIRFLAFELITELYSQPWGLPVIPLIFLDKFSHKVI